MRPLPAFVRALALLLFVLSVLSASHVARADVVPPAASGDALVAPPPVPAAAAARPLDPMSATRAYLDTVPADAHARSDAYFEGGYWLILVEFLAGSLIALLLLHTGASAKMRDLARRVTRVRFAQSAIYWLLYLAAITLLGFPLSVYVDFVREHSYGLSNMTFGGWLADQAKALGIAALFGSLLVPALYAVVARAKRTWWLWGSLVVIAFTAFGSVIAPVFLAPVFNHYTAVTNAKVRDPILSLARANGIPATEVWQFDASRQSNRVSANVSGLFGTERISLNDNLLKRCSLPEIEAVMGHEMGHYVLNHVTKSMIGIGLIVVFGFAFVRFGFERLRSRFAERWKVEGIEDPAGLPLILLLISAYSFVLTPLTNTMTRSAEAEADIFGVNASGQPDGMSQVALKLGEYRKLEPGPIEELVFFDHPSGRSRILMAMRWKAEHMGDATAASPASSGTSP